MPDTSSPAYKKEMAAKMRNAKTRTAPTNRFEVFVKRSIGSVELNEFGEENAVTAAFKLIGESGEEGTFEFEMPSPNIANERLAATINVTYQRLNEDGTPLAFTDH